MTKSSLSRGRLTALLGGVLVSAGVLTVGCLERPVAGIEPNTTNVFVEQIVNKNIDKIDLLFVIDNSISMADKQSILEGAVPKMVERLVIPDCVKRDNQGNVVSRGPSTPAATPGEKPSCASGTELEFDPINDIHIGVITSSLGGTGSDYCKGDPNTPENSNDRSLLIPKAPKGTPPADRPDIPDPTGKGFLVWYPQQDPEAPRPESEVEANLSDLTANFRKHVVGAGEWGCGFEAPLEAWYRFLVDPSPSSRVTTEGTGINKMTKVEFPDNEILQQRAAFLRSDSLVAVVVLTDENDCSVIEGGPYYPLAGLGWRLPAAATPMRIATSVCDENPNDACCFSCLQKAPSNCSNGEALYAQCFDPGQNAIHIEASLDRGNARCLQNKRRFGFDYLYPTQRYVDGLTKETIVDTKTGEETFNPLLRGVDGKQPRDPSFVFFAGIVGVPWQDIADTESLKGENANRLKYLTAEQLRQPDVEVNGTKVDRWAVILGENFLAQNSKACRENPTNASCGKAPVPPLDPFMIESVQPRSGVNPIVPEIAITQVGTWNAINGHEYDNSVPFNQSNNGLNGDSGPANDDLQYACIFPLKPYDAVKEDCVLGDAGCDCGDEPLKNRPLCRDAGTDPAGTTQYWGKAYPGTRVLQVLRDFGDNSIVASICPKIHDPTQSDYGYNPAVGAIVDRLAEKLGGQCLPRELTIDENTGLVPCSVVEVLDASQGTLDCGSEGRGVVGEKIKPVVLKKLEESDLCGANSDKSCDTFQMCEIKQFEAGAAREECLTGAKGSESQMPAGYCYVDPAKGLGSPDVVASCDATQRRLLRFVGNETPVNNSITFVACTADAAQETPGTATPPTGNQGGAGN